MIPAFRRQRQSRHISEFEDGPVSIERERVRRGRLKTEPSD